MQATTSNKDSSDKSCLNRFSHADSFESRFQFSVFTFGKKTRGKALCQQSQDSKTHLGAANHVLADLWPSACTITLTDVAVCSAAVCHLARLR